MDTYLLKCSRIFSSRILSGRFPTQRWRVSLTIMSPTLHHSGTRPNTQVAHNDSTAVQRDSGTTGTYTVTQTQGTHTHTRTGKRWRRRKTKTTVVYTDISRPDTQRALSSDALARSKRQRRRRYHVRVDARHTTHTRGANETTEIIMRKPRTNQTKLHSDISHLHVRFERQKKIK